MIALKENNMVNNKEIILTFDEIAKYNEKIKHKTSMYYDIFNISSLSKENIFKYINEYKFPLFKKSNENSVLNNFNVNAILNNRNLDKIENIKTIPKGIIIKRANLRSFPTNSHLYTTNNNFDRFQQTELHVNTPVLIIHVSKDNKWYFIISFFYTGWVEKDNVANAHESDFEYFINNKSFGIITVPSVNIENTILDMSVKLPYLGETNNKVKLFLPIKNNNGFVDGKTIILDKKSVNIGYLPFTKENEIKIAKKYEGSKYSWGGLDNGIDCSSFISNVYRTFGFYFPRNTSNQSKSVGKIISLDNKTESQKLEIINNTEPSLLFKPNHVMLYIGKCNGKHYIIHANEMTMSVAITELSKDSEYLKKADKLVLVK